MVSFDRLVRDLPVTNLAKRGFQKRLESSESSQFETALREDITDDVWAEFFDRKAKEGNTILELVAKGMLSKSYTGIDISASLNERPLTLDDNIFAHQEDLLARAPLIQPGSCLLNDEKTADWGMGVVRRAKDYENLIQVCRKYKLSLVNCSVVPRMREGLSHFELHPLFIHREEQYAHVAIYEPKLLSRFYDLECLGYARFYHPVRKVGAEFMAEYERRKDVAIKEVLCQTTGDEYTDVAIVVEKLPDFRELVLACSNPKKGRLRCPSKDELVELVTDVRPDYRRGIEADQVSVILAMRFKMRRTTGYDEMLDSLGESGDELPE